MYRVCSCKQECIPVGCVPSAAVAVCWGVSARGVSTHGGVSAQGGCLPRGRVYPCMHWGRHNPPPRQNSWHMLVKVLPCSNFVANGNQRHYKTDQMLYESSTMVAFGREHLHPLHGVPTTESAFIEWESTIHRSPPPPKVLGQKAKSNNYGDSNKPLIPLWFLHYITIPRKRMPFVGHLIPILNFGGFF